ncbi:hypothetical protein A2662_02750 [Candidatus Giovannonibacteria bacterium RIFCSPHIGHO2_01_FULL_45_33]|uniref:Uncharacterized protein n=1 Tax=Candidatus Giovannonibacteria bacterium RIFCSPLOWO2_01_FULL_45_34 TaxID=1798351 RepID=A0A1F5X1G5_9BACT|nr:MAG: hypothetical protein A2662_02750 [Candidatus Giovannonibacteria bacterium RIFCSPHIGHO2_01_FULL_45_33]OGF70932.1 MAG: hypothetical protein A3C73_00985 [Candidatus Giovannonibacteria bacterium RIFCSPHIGHO2_02_FULL_44_11]OGF81732.1 MAG: hypothetical protein A2930_03995 [Candidatus Giovannonibacteria bacterium RIFCSPLOWO2_01_FULL_45_34]
MQTPEWEIGKEEFLKRLGLSGGDLVRRMNLPDLDTAEHIIPLRYMKNVGELSPISWDLAKYLMSKMRTMNGHYPFSEAQISLRKFDPNGLKVGQKFAYEENLSGVLKELPSFFRNYMIPSGISELGAWFVFGRDLEDVPAFSCYLPPIVERHGKNFVIMDGIHRNYIAKQVGVSLNAILAENISVPFPCGMKNWEELSVISLKDKPADINERYFTLTKELFRDLKYLGIDG